MTERVIDSGDGRKFTIRESDPADMLDLIEAAGSAASSGAWIQYALMLCSVSAIDGVPVLMPDTKDKVKALAKKIGNSGIGALSKDYYRKDVVEGTGSEEMETAKN